MTLRIERYGNSRYWALYDGPDLVVVTLYQRGAQEVRRRPRWPGPAPSPPVRRERHRRPRVSRYRGAGGHPIGARISCKS